ncbi:MAG: FecR domain-containing protein [Chloroflexi bacterium]|nr:FecR domain-containing protein [Chloroflexota bacterium]
MNIRSPFLTILSAAALLAVACNLTLTTPSGDAPTAVPASAAALAAAETPAGPRQAWLSELENEVFWQPFEQEEWLAAQVDQALENGNRVNTGAESRAAVAFSEGTLARLAPNTLFILHDLSGTTAEPQTLLELLKGELFVILEGALGGGTFKVDTISGTASVRGTWLGVRLNALGQLFATCLEGVCSVANSLGSVQFSGGQRAEILDAGAPPTPPERMEPYQLNAWIANVPGAVNLAVDQGLLDPDDLPEGCDPATGEGCELPLDCDPLTGAGCDLPPDCDPATGLGCTLPSGCNPITGQGCDLPPGCDPDTGEGCTLPWGCNLVTGEGCLLGAFCDSSVYPECALLENCNFITGEGCVIEGCNIVTLEGCGLPPGVGPGTGP